MAESQNGRQAFRLAVGSIRRMSACRQKVRLAGKLAGKLASKIAGRQTGWNAGRESRLTGRGRRASR